MFWTSSSRRKCSKTFHLEPHDIPDVSGSAGEVDQQVVGYEPSLLEGEAQMVQQFADIVPVVQNTELPEDKLLYQQRGPTGCRVAGLQGVRL